MAERTNKQINWIHVEKDYCTNTKKHAYCVGKFVRIKDIREDLVKDWGDGDLQNSSDYSCYNMTAEDKEDLKETHAKYAHFPITHLVHDTEIENVLSILKDGKMIKGREKKYKISEKEQSYCFSWWGLAYDENQTIKYRETMTNTIGSKLYKNNNDKQDIQLLSSHPFSGKSKERYGPWRFSVPVNELLKCYKDSVGEYETRILCTEVYAHEVMHAILVHPTSMNEEFKEDLPTLKDYMEKEPIPVVRKKGDQLIWHPLSTSVRHPDCKNRKKVKCKRWDHLTFAFLIPQEKAMPPASTQARTPCDGIAIPFKLLIDKLQNLILGHNHKVNASTLRDEESESNQMPPDKFKLFIDRFWDIIQDNLSKGNLFIVRDQCIHIKKLIEITPENFGEIYPGNLPKQKEKFRTAIKDIWTVVENKLTEEKLIADAKDSGSKPEYQLTDGIKALEDVIEHASKFTLDLFPEEFPGFRQNILRSLPETLAKSLYKIQPTDYYEKKMFEINDKIWLKLWETIPRLYKKYSYNSYILSPEEFKEEENKIKGAIDQIWNIMEGLLFYEYSFWSISKITIKLLPENFSGYCQNIQRYLKALGGQSSPLNYKYWLLQNSEYVWWSLWDMYTKTSPDKVKEQEEKLNLKAVFITFWEIIRSTLSQRNDLLLIPAQCEFIERFINVIEKEFGEIFPEERIKHREKLREYVIDVCKMVTIDINQFQRTFGKENRAELDMKPAFENVLNLAMKLLLEEFPGFCQEILLFQATKAERSVDDYISNSIWEKLWKTISLLANKQKDNVQNNSSPEEIKEEENKIKAALHKFWDIIQDSLPQGKWSEMKRQCENIQKLIELIREDFGEIFPGELPKHEKTLFGAIVKVWNVIQTEQTLVAEGQHINNDADLKNRLSVVEDVLEVTKKLLPGEFLDSCQIIERPAQAFKGVLPHDIARDVFVKFWNIIQVNLSKANVITVIYDQLDDIEKLVKIIPENLWKIPEHKEKLRATIKEIWQLIVKVQTEEKLEEAFSFTPSYALYNGVSCLKMVVERVLNLILNTLPPDDLLNYTENIKRSVKMVSDLRSYYLVNIKPAFFRNTSETIQKIWHKMRETDNLSDIKGQCDIIKKIIELIKFISKYESGVSVDKMELRRTMRKVSKILETNVDKEKLMAEGRQTNKDKNNADALADGIDALRECFSLFQNICLCHVGFCDYSKFFDFLWHIFQNTEDLKKKIDIVDIYLACLKKQSPENEHIKEKTVAEDRQISTFNNDPLEDGIKLLRIAVGRVSEISRKTLPPKELLGYCQNIQQSRQAVRLHTETNLIDNSCKRRFDKIAKEVVDRLWNTMQDREAINEMWKTIESKQKELAAEGNQENENHMAHADDIDTLGDAVDSISKLTNTLPCQFLLNFWDIIQGNISQLKDLSVMRNQCDHIEMLMELIRNNLKGIFPEELLQQHEGKLQDSINKMWHIISIKTRYEEIDALEDRAVERVSEFITLMLPPKKWLFYCQNIHRSEKQAQCPNEDGFCKMTKGIVDKFWVIVENNLSEGNYLYDIRDQCDHIEKLNRKFQEHKKIFPEDQEMLQKHEQKIRAAIKLVEDSRQGKEDRPFQHFMDALYPVVEDISKLTGKESEEEVKQNCQKVQQSLYAVKDIPYSPCWIKPCKPDFDQKFKAIVDKFRDIIESNLSEEKCLSVIKDQCYGMKKLIGIIEKNFGEIFPDEIRKYKEKLRVCIVKAWEVIEGKQTEEKLTMDNKQRHNWDIRALEDGIKDLRDAFECVSELTMQWFPDEFPVHCQNILHSQQSAISEEPSACYKRHLDEMSKDMWKKLMETIPLLANRHQDTIKTNLKKMSEDEIKEQEDKIKGALLKFWTVIEINISVGKLSKMTDQCTNAKELIGLIRQHFGKILPEEISKHEEKAIEVSIVKVLEVIKTGQTKENLIAEGRQTGKNEDCHENEALEHGLRNLFSVIKDVLEIMKKLPPAEFLGYCQIIKRSQLDAEGEKSHDVDFVDPHSRYLYQVSQDVLFKLWSIIQDNVSEESYLSVIPNQCDHITKLITIVQENFGEVFLKEHQKELRKSIEKLWHLIQTKQTKGNLLTDGRQENKNQKDNEALDAGITTLFEVIQRVLKLSMECFPEEFPCNYQNILQFQQTVESEQSRDSDAVEQKHYFYRISKDVLVKFLDIIVNCLSQEKCLSVIRNQCEHIEKLLKISRENFGEILEYQDTLRAAIAKVWGIIETKQTEEKLIAEGRQKITYSAYKSINSEALGDGIKILGDVIERLSELTMKTVAD